MPPDPADVRRPEDRNGTHNADAILFWRQYVDLSRQSDALYDDDGGYGGLALGPPHGVGRPRRPLKLLLIVMHAPGLFDAGMPPDDR